MNFEKLTAELNKHHIEGFAHQGGVNFSVPLISHVEGNLYQGGCRNGTYLGNHFNHIISLYPWERYATPIISSYTEVKLFDSGNVPNRDVLYRLADWVNWCRKDETTLVHCQAGLNRSALVCALALIREWDEDGMKRVRTPVQAIKLLRDVRSPAVLCNQVFEKFLLEVDHTI